MDYGIVVGESFRGPVLMFWGIWFWVIGAWAVWVVGDYGLGGSRLSGIRGWGSAWGIWV